MSPHVPFGQLCRLLQVAPRRLRELFALGAPHRIWGRRRMFDPVAVAMWLHAKGIPANSEPSTAVVSTRREAAKAFGVCERTITRWSRRANFPGRIGQRGRKNGHFPIQEITRWLTQTTATTTTRKRTIE